MKAHLLQVFLKHGIKLLFCAAGLQLSYLTWGVLQERIVTRSYEEHLPDGSVKLVKFTNSQFLVFVNRSLALVVASFCILFTRQPRHTAPLYKYSYSSFSNITSFICMTKKTHTVLQKLCLEIKITTQGNYVTLIIICHEHQNKLKYIFYELHIDEVIRRVHQFIDQTVYR